MRLRKTNPGDLPQLKALWALGFGDTEQEIEAFFAISYPTATGFCAEEDGKVIAAAYALPQELAWGEKSCRSAYLYAVTTHPDFRRRGICAKLLAYAEKELKKRYFDCLTLVPRRTRCARIMRRWASSRRTRPFSTRAARRRHAAYARR
ncbi:MAG: GNAT family N-acetyltransferase [Oscillospiraceae bacterium]